MNEHNQGLEPTDNAAVVEEPQQEPVVAGEAQQRAQLEAQMRSGVSWFFWIAGLSMVNAVIHMMNSETTFIVGLGVTTVIDYIAGELATDIGMVAKIIALVLDTGFAGFFAAFGVLGMYRQGWAVMIGMFFYALDGLLLLYIGDFLSVAFHAFALYCIFLGLRAVWQLKRVGEPAIAMA